MPELLIILSPPRSFSSVVSTMIGEHPELYCFPELHLFNGDTIEEVITHQRGMRVRFGPYGVVRALAQLHDGVQTTGTILKAIAWLQERRDWSTKKLYDYLLAQIAPLIGVEKSPETATRELFLERAYAQFPNAYYPLLARHPVSSAKSMREFFEDLWHLEGGKNYILLWYKTHANILNFTRKLPTGQTMRIRGEDVLSEPDVFLPQISEWMGLRTDAQAIDAMKHPENSPYAFVGPDPAPGGNDKKFCENPRLRQGKVKEPSFKDYLEKGVTWVKEDARERFDNAGLELASEKQLTEEVMHLANLMGYQ